MIGMEEYQYTSMNTNEERYISPCPTMTDEDDSVNRVRYISHLIRRNELKPGDHIYVYRALHLYQHHGIYIGEEGDNEVIHVNGNKYNTSTATVTSTSLSEFLNGGLLHLVSYKDPKTKLKIRGTSHTSFSRPSKEVVRTAKEMLQNPENWGMYNLVYRNCETFAYFCKTGTEPIIGQMNSELRDRSKTNRVQGTGLLARHVLVHFVENSEDEDEH